MNLHSLENREIMKTINAFTDMKRIVGTIVVSILALTTFAQKAWVVPTRFNPDDSITIYVDVSKTDCPRLKDTQEDVYYWGWQPAEPVVGNGEWTSSNEDLKMTRSSDNPNVYFLKVVPNQFYSVNTDKQIYDNGLAFLVKLKDGTGEGGGGCDEDKTEDLIVEVEPIPGCNTKYCQTPTTPFPDDYFTFIYNPSEETNAFMSEDEVGTDNFSVYIEVTYTDGTNEEYASLTEVKNFEELSLKKDMESGFYKLTFLPEAYFTAPEGESIQTITFQTMDKTYSGGIPTADLSGGPAYIVGFGCD